MPKNIKNIRRSKRLARHNINKIIELNDSVKDSNINMDSDNDHENSTKVNTKKFSTLISDSDPCDEYYESDQYSDSDQRIKLDKSNKPIGLENEDLIQLSDIMDDDDWERSVTKKEYKRLTPVRINVVNSLISLNPNVVDIIKLKVSMYIQRHILQTFMQWKTLEPYSTEWIYYRDYIKNKIKKYQATPMKKRDIKEFDKNFVQMENIQINMIPSDIDVYNAKCATDEKMALIYKYRELDNTYNPPLNDIKDISKTISVYNNNILTKDDIDKYDTICNKLSVTTSRDDILRRIILSNMPNKHKEIVYDNYIKLCSINNSNDEYIKLKNWIDSALRIPFSVKELAVNNQSPAADRINFLNDVRKTLNNEIRGLDSVKDQIMMILNNKISNINYTGVSLALVGPPGIGKTAICKAVAKSVNLPFQQISMGGVIDSDYIHGHDYTYIGSKEGIIAKTMQSLQFKNGIIFFDEFDKIGASDRGREVQHALLHIIDFVQNKEFVDKFLAGFPIDLSHVWFMYAMNSTDDLDGALLNRINPIRLSDYTLNEKIEIVKYNLWPNGLKNVSIPDNEIIVTDDIYHYLTTKCAIDLDTPGMRVIKRNIDNIISRINMLKSLTTLDDITYTTPFTLTKRVIDILFKDHDKLPRIDNMMYS